MDLLCQKKHFWNPFRSLDVRKCQPHVWLRIKYFVYWAQSKHNCITKTTVKNIQYSKILYVLDKYTIDTTLPFIIHSSSLQFNKIIMFYHSHGTKKCSSKLTWSSTSSYIVKLYSVLHFQQTTWDFDIRIEIKL